MSQLSLFDEVPQKPYFTIQKASGRFHYPNDRKIFELERIKVIDSKPFVYFFKCGHWCTDNIFLDLFDVETGIQNYKLTKA